MILMKKEKELFEDLMDFTIKIVDYVEKNKANYKPNISGDFYQVKVSNFEYNENGATLSKSLDRIEFRTWYRAIDDAINDITKLDAYKTIVRKLEEDYFIEKAEKILHDLIANIVKKIFNEKLKGPKTISDILSVFIKQLKDEPINSNAIIGIKDLVILTAPIEFNYKKTNYLLRRPVKEDFEGIEPILSPSDRLYHPDAFLVISSKVKSFREMQLLKERAITILRLFRVGSIIDLECSINSEAVISSINPYIGASITLSRRLLKPAHIKAIIKPETIDELLGFWELMEKNLPRDFFTYKKEKVDYLHVAYLRYRDALFHSFLLEERITNIVMGLEAIFLGTSDSGELNFRLRLRIAKLLGLLRIDSSDRISQIIKEAYKIRSKYVHSHSLEMKTYDKIEKEFGSISDFIYSLLDFLRKSILIAIFLKVTKKELHRLIDHSLINEDKDLLNTLLSKIPDNNGLQIKKVTIPISDDNEQIVFYYTAFIPTNYTKDDIKRLSEKIKEKYTFPKK